MRTPCILWACLVAVILAADLTGNAHAAEAERRIALVIGIGAYQNAPALPNPSNDARAFAEALRGLEFEVTERYDLDNRGFATTLRDFGIQAADADVALMFYAGHGIQIGGINYLIPSDARLERQRDLVYEALPLSLALGELAQARKLGVLILDACRNNPFVDRLTRTASGAIAAQAGLAGLDDTPSDTLVAMATRADQVAEDGQGLHSPYTTALLQHLKTPGLELSVFFRKVRDTVRQATGGRQEPFIYGSLGAAPFYFNPMPPNREPVVAASTGIEVQDRGEMRPLALSRPTDPDGDDLVVRITGLPRGGTVRVGDRVVLNGDHLTVDQLAGIVFQPDASLTGDAGNLDFTVLDGRGGMARGSVPIVIKPSNHPPVAVAERMVQVLPTALGIKPPTDPDGDPLTITVMTVPERGTVRKGDRPVRPGDLLSAEDLAGLSFDPGQAPPGRAGTFSIAVDDGRGGVVRSSVLLDVVGEAGRPLDDGAMVAMTEPPAPPSTPVPSTPATPGPPAPPVSSSAVAPAVPPGRPDTDLHVAVAGANIRAQPVASARRVGRIVQGARVRVLERAKGGDWYRVALDDGTEGFVYAPLIRPAADTDRHAGGDGKGADAGTAAPPGIPAKAVDEKGGETAEQATVPEDGSSMVAMAAPPSAAVRTHGAANSFQDCPDCPVMVRLRPGSFTMGDNKGDPLQRPAHMVTIARPFALGAYEVTVAEWRICVDEGGCSEMPRMTDATDSTPVHNIHWQDAESYVNWLSRKTGYRYRLPSEAEWEYAARGGTGRHFWWGEVAAGHANCADCGGEYRRLTPASAGSFAANPFGLHDMNGGVAEWVQDCWNESYKGAPGDGRAWTQGSCRKRVLRGGSWRDGLNEISTTARWGYDMDVRYLANGFRVARDIQ